jgi:hypothetical protein
MPKRFDFYRTGVAVLVLLGAAIFGRMILYPPSVPKAPPDAAPSLIGSERPDRPVVLYYHERRPYYVTTPKQVHGLIADRVNWIFKEAGIPYVWRKTPAKRQLEMIRSNEQRACAVGWFKTPERETFGHFTSPVYMESPTMAIARADNDQIHSGGTLAQTLANRRLKLLRKDGYSYGQYFDDNLKRYAPREIVTTAENISMIKMIHTHRADYFFITREEAEDVVLCSGLPAEDFKVIAFVDMPPGNERYLICSRQIDQMTRLRLNSAIKDYLPGSMAATPTEKAIPQ